MSAKSFCRYKVYLPGCAGISSAENERREGVTHMKKTLIFLLSLMALLSYTGIAYALGDIPPTTYDLNQPRNGYPAKDWNYKEQGKNVASGNYTGSIGFGTSTHPYGTWNSPYTLGIDGYNYNDAQDYTDDGTMTGTGLYTSGPHGGYLTATHKCRECHAVHRAAGKFKLLRSDTRFEACDWCHGTGAGSGFNIQMDNDDNYITEYNTGHTMGFGISSGKWKAPDDTYPAFTPNYWLGGFSCFDCHSPHANPARMLGYNDAGVAVGLEVTNIASPKYGQILGVVNSGHGQTTYGDASASELPCLDCHWKSRSTAWGDLALTHNPFPVYRSGSWLLIKNPDREIATRAETGIAYFDLDSGNSTTDVAVGQEISDRIAATSQVINGVATVTAGLFHQFDTDTPYPVSKLAIDWNSPVGIPLYDETSSGFDLRATVKKVWSVDEFCTDCHDGNAGLHTVQAPLFSEDRALRTQTQTSAKDSTAVVDDAKFKGSYDLGYGHDAQPRHCTRQMKFNPEDNYDYGPRCRNCHRGSSDCGNCHGGKYIWPRDVIGGDSPETILGYSADNTIVYPPQPPTSPVDQQFGPDWPRMFFGVSTFNPRSTSPNYVPGQSASQNVDSIDSVFFKTFSVPADGTGQYKTSRTVRWENNWRSDPGLVNGDCSNDGFSWPHRTLGWKMLKDDLFGLDLQGNVVGVGDTRTAPDGSIWVAQDLDSVCLDCHNPTVWRATDASNHVDNPANPNDNYNDELLTRGLP